MDLKVFYRKLRELEASIAEAYVVIVSQETPDGGRAGVRTEAPREVAARMVVEGKARLATPEEAAEYLVQMAEAKKAAEQLAAASRVQFTVLSEAELRALRGAVRSGK
ncbi:MAG: hypothetical protein AAB225_17385 [Acidobacteriota bacterium]